MLVWLLEPIPSERHFKVQLKYGGRIMSLVREGHPTGWSTVLVTALDSRGKHREGDPTGWSTVLVTALVSWGEPAPRGHTSNIYRMFCSGRVWAEGSIPKTREPSALMGLLSGVQVGVPLANHVLAGYNACCVAYGQAGSGKSYRFNTYFVPLPVALFAYHPSIAK
jgi:hypothetical protein